MWRLATVLILLALLTSPASAATVAHLIATPSTANTTSYASGAFTPTANDLLVAFVACTDSTTAAAESLTDSQALGFTQIQASARAASAHSGYLFVANALAAASSMTVTFTTDDSATGCDIAVAGVAGMTKTGSTAVRQSGKDDNQASAGTPAISAFGAAVDTNNPTLAAVISATDLATTPSYTPPTDWTEAVETGHITATNGLTYVYRNSGYTGTTIVWVADDGTQFGDIIVELDASVTSTGPPVGSMMLMGVGR